MAGFSKTWLMKQGLGVTPDRFDELFATLEAVLEMRVGNYLASQLSDAQIDEFEKLLATTEDNDKDDFRIDWLERTYPKYDRVVRYQKAKLSKEIRSSKDKAGRIMQLGESEVPA